MKWSSFRSALLIAAVSLLALILPGGSGQAAAGDITTVAGTGTAGFSGDGGSAISAALFFPTTVAVDSVGRVFVSDANNCRVRRVDPSGLITTVAGNGACTLAGDGGPAISASLEVPIGVAVDSMGNLYIADQGNCRIRRVDSASGVISTIAGTHPGTGFCVSTGDGGPATDAGVFFPHGIEVDNAGNVYFTEAGSPCSVRRINTAGIISRVAGPGSCASGGDGGPATATNVNHPTDIAIDPEGNLYIAEFVGCKIRKVDSSGVISTVAGTGVCFGPLGDGGPATSASLGFPTGVDIDAVGNIFIASRGHCRVRRVDTAGTITTIAGNGVCGFAGDGGSATAASLNGPFGVGLGLSGNLYIADSDNHRVRRVEDVAITRIPITIDIKPGSDPNSITPKSRGTIPVAILSSPGFDAPSEVDKASPTFGPTGDEESLAFCTKSAEDVNGDGLLDLVCHFHMQDTGFQCGDTEGVLRGETLDGVPIEGSDSVRIVPCR